MLEVPVFGLARGALDCSPLRVLVLAMTAHRTISFH